MSMADTDAEDDAPRVNMDELLDDFDELKMDDAE
jgi:nonsense-mediated mRNA decay protein 3